MRRPRAGSDAPGDRRARLWRLAERIAWAIAVACLLVWSGFHVDRIASRQRGMARLAALQAAPAASAQAADPDLSLWSPERIAAWRAVRSSGPAPLAILRIPRLRVDVLVLEGTDDLTLNRGAGHIEDTARPGTDGNSGIAAHRDGFFRALKDIAVGDVIELETAGAIEHYRVERTWVVDPEDVSVLDPTPTRALTLVTCYPFYFVGSAPQRFIVRAVTTSQTPPAAKTARRE